MESYLKEPGFPPKAGVYAVREGPIIAKNAVAFLEKREMQKYVPQRDFLSLLMTGDSSAIGVKLGVAFVGNWVWEMKDFIDKSFMNMFSTRFLFKDCEQGTFEEPIEHAELFEDKTS